MQKRLRQSFPAVLGSSVISTWPNSKPKKKKRNSEVSADTARAEAVILHVELLYFPAFSAVFFFVSLSKGKYFC